MSRKAQPKASAGLDGRSKAPRRRSTKNGTPKNGALQPAVDDDAAPSVHGLDGSLNGDAPSTKAWSAPGPHMLGAARDAYRVPVLSVTVHTDPSLLPDAPGESGGLFELVS